MPPPILVHAPATFRRLAMRPGPAFDLLELFAFVRPAHTAAPTPRGLALALDDDQPPIGLEAEVSRLPDFAAALLNQLSQGRDTLLNRDAAVLAARMQKAGWGWGGYVTHALGRPDAAASNEPLKVWKKLPEWEEPPPCPRRPPTRSRTPKPAPGSPSCSGRMPNSGLARATMPAPPPPPSRRAKSAAIRIWCWRRPAPAPARRWATSRRQRVGGEEQRRGVDQHLHPPLAAADRRRTGTADPRPDRTAAADRGAQGARELSVPAEPGGRGRHRCQRAS